MPFAGAPAGGLQNLNSPDNPLDNVAGPYPMDSYRYADGHVPGQAPPESVPLDAANNAASNVDYSPIGASPDADASGGGGD